METINYQGQDIAVELVNYLSGNIPTSTISCEGDEQLFRDAAGRYYLRRQLSRSDREHVHRISPTAAVLWATTRLNSKTLHLRCDAANLLMDGREYVDPQNDGSKLQAPPPAPDDHEPAAVEDGGHRAVYRRTDKKGRVFEYHVTLNAKQTRDIERLASSLGLSLPEYIQSFLEGLPNQEAHRENALPTGELPSLDFIDERTLRRLQRVAEFRGMDFAEFIQADFESTFETWENDMIFHPESGELIADDDDSAHLAIQRDVRRVLDALGMAAEAEDDDEADEDEDEADEEGSEEAEAGQSSDDALFTIKAGCVARWLESGPIRAAIDLPPTAKQCGERYKFDLDEAQADQARSLASVFGLSLAEFLRRLAARELPNQPQRKHGSLAESLQSEHVTFACAEPGMLRRIEAVAAYNGQSVEDMVADAVGGHVDAHEQDCIAHPETGELLMEENDLRPDPVLSAPPVGQEDNPAWRFIGQKQRHVSVPLSENAACVLDEKGARPL